MKWEALREGDIVDIVAPGFVSQPEDLAKAIDFLKKWKLVPRVPQNIIGKNYLFSNKDEIRFEHLKKAIVAKDSKAIWCLRGGYGSIRLLPLLDQVKKVQPKLLIGISDITSLHIYFNQKHGWVTLHAPLLDRLGNGKVPTRYEKELKNVLFGKQQIVEFKKIKPLNGLAKQKQVIHAPVVGGNFVTLQSTIGTPYQINLKNKILFIEDLGERGYRIDRIFCHLEQAGLLKGCKALVIGEFLGGYEPNSQNALWKKVFQEWAQRLNFPVFVGVEAGHGLVQRPLALNSKAEIHITDKSILKVEAGF